MPLNKKQYQESISQILEYYESNTYQAQYAEYRRRRNEMMNDFRVQHSTLYIPRIPHWSNDIITKDKTIYKKKKNRWL